MSDFPRIVDLPDDGSQQKEVYAVAGLALYQAQVWERGMINLTLIMRRATGELPTVEEWDRSEERLVSLTAGKLCRIIKDERLAPTSTFQVWREALKWRNLLAHRFFYNHAISFMVPEGRQTMLDELEAMLHKFEDADKETQKAIQRVTTKWGISDEEIQALSDSLVENYKHDDNPTPDS